MDAHSTSNKNIVAAVVKLLREDPHSCTQEVSARLLLLFGKVQEILHRASPSEAGHKLGTS